VAEQTPSRELVRAVGREFDDRGWSDPDDLALAIVRVAERSGELDPKAAADLADPSFLESNGISRTTLRNAIATVFAGRTLLPEQGPAPTFVDQSVRIGDNNTISGAINAGGNQLVLTQDTPPEQLLSAIGNFVASAVDNGFAPQELQLLDRLAEDRKLPAEQLDAAVRAGIESAEAGPGRLAMFRDAVLTSATSGLVVQAIISAAGATL
jgi:hypothetical protein